ncbi:MAG TPA: phosphatase PAP2 family protein [Chitinophagaceae bacterium]|nr:phosphatase PAP2 family protein [Chitinophagaceae bacterium]
MRTRGYLLLRLLPVITAMVAWPCFFSANGQSTARNRTSTFADAHTWKTWVINTDALTVPAAPTQAQMQKELSKVKAMMQERDESIMQQIRYWDAGPPSYRWNEIGYRLVGPELFSKKDGGVFWYGPMAWMNMAIYDATIAAWKLKYSYQGQYPSQMDASIKPVIALPQVPSYPCEYSVTAAAAATVLAHFFPEVSDSLIELGKKAMYSRVYAGVQFPGSVAAGWDLGKKVAEKVIEAAKAHISGRTWKGSIPNDANRWRGEFAVGAVTTALQPIVLRTGNQFRPPAPPDFKKEMEEMKNFKQNFYTVYQAYRWASSSGLDIWTDFASLRILERRLDKDAPACARIYAILHVSLYDCAIAIMDAKYAYFGIRPFQLESGFTPLIGSTPPFPGYPSGHATASSCAATILSHFFPEDSRFFEQTARECANSRFYAGIHFQTDNSVGLEMGRKLANYIIEEWAKKDGAER